MTATNRNTRFTRNKTEDVSSLLYGKVPPQAKELEQAVIGACLIEYETIHVIASYLKPEHFYVDAHSTIYEAILTLFKKSIKTDLLLVTEELRNIGKLEEVGGAYYLSQCTNVVASSANVEYHANVIIYKYLQRETIRICSNTTNTAYDDIENATEMVGKTISDLNKLLEQSSNGGFKHISDKAMETFMNVENARQSDSKIIGVACGITNIDNKIHGFKKQDLIIIAGRPSMGKTALVVSMAYETAKLGIPVAINSLEMSKEALMKRIVSLDSEVDLEKVINGTYDDREGDLILQSYKRIQDLPIFIDETAAISIIEYKARLSYLVRKIGIQHAYVDYLQLMTSGERGIMREQEISTISRGLKNTAKELDIPITALSQLNRSVESRGGDKKPMLSDLRESGAIEQDADMVMFVYRPEYYGISETSEGQSTRNYAELNIAKYRNGKTCNITDLVFRKELAKFQSHMPYESTLSNYEEQKPNDKQKFDLF